MPTLDRPFGVHLWPIFDKAWTACVGYPAEEFKFVPFETPMSTLKSTSIFIVIYYTVIFGGREVMRNRAPFKLQTLFLIHNFILTAVSAILLALYIEELLPTVVRHGIFYAICDHNGGWTQHLVVLYYVRPFCWFILVYDPLMLTILQLTYLTKYLELIDTVFLFLKKKPLSMRPACIVNLANVLLTSSQRFFTAITTAPPLCSATLSSSAPLRCPGFPSP
jgi:fatty acid elongase 3